MTELWPPPQIVQGPEVLRSCRVQCHDLPYLVTLLTLRIVGALTSADRENVPHAALGRP